jgi:hypothetical protein
MIQIVVSLSDDSFMLLESLIMLLENIYTTGITHDDCHLRSLFFIVQATGLTSKF